MSAIRNESPAQSAAALSAKGCKVTPKWLLIIPYPNNMGNRSWGRVDNLVRQGYILSWTFADRK